MSMYNFKNKKGRKKKTLPSSQLSSSAQRPFAPTAASIHWVVRARETFQTHVNPDAHREEGRGTPTRQMGSPRLGGRRCRDRTQCANSRPRCFPASAGTRQPPPGLHRGLPSRKLKVKRMCSFSLFSFPKRGCWAGQSCLSDVSKSADFASCLCLTICDYSKSNWLAAIRSKPVIQGKKHSKLLNKQTKE